MKTSPTITKIASALLKAQGAMGTAIKDAKNPFFKSKYADLNSIREACMPSLQTNGITLLQPTITIDGKNYVETILIHESGEWMSCETEILFGKKDDAQAQGSGITYARRYGMQSFLNVGADDDDGNTASQPAKEQPKADKLEHPIDGIKAKVATIETVEELNAYYAIIKNNTPAVVSIFANRKKEITK
jgi:hypothetical protein